MAKTPITDLAGFAGEHLEYEVRMFLTARNKLFKSAPQCFPDTDAAFNRNLLIESCVLHFRNPVDFFYPPSPARPDDVSAADYVPGWGSPVVPTILKDARIRANKELGPPHVEAINGGTPKQSLGFR